LTPKKNQDSRLALASRGGQSLCYGDSYGDSGGPVYSEVDGEVRLIGINQAIIHHPRKGVEECKFAFVQVFTPIEPSRAWLEGAIK
jgi:hypothetical protein